VSGDRRGDDAPSGSPPGLDDELAVLRAQVARLRVENARLLRLLDLSPGQAGVPGPIQAAMFDAPPGPVAASSPPSAKVAFFAALFAARAEVYALRWENARSGRLGGCRPCGAVGGAVCHPGSASTCR